MSCLGIKSTDSTPWVNRGVLATATLAVATILACAAIALLVNYGVFKLPAALTINHLLIAGVAGGVFFTLISFAIKCCSGTQKKAGDPGQKNKDVLEGNKAKPKKGSDKSEAQDPSKSKSAQKEESDSSDSTSGKKEGGSFLSPDGKGEIPTGAKGDGSAQKSFKVQHGGSKDVLE